MKDYSYFIPGYTGFCPELKEHFGETYGHATRHIIYDKPHLEGRLAPVFYKHRRSGTDKKMYGKYCDQEKSKYDPTKAGHRKEIPYPGREKYHTDVYDDGDGRFRPEHGKAFSSRGKRGTVYDASEGKYRVCYDDGDRVRQVEHECPCPKYFFFQGYTGCVPEYQNKHGRQDSYYNRTPFTTPASACQLNLQRDSMHLKEHPEACQKKVSHKDPRMSRVPRIKPHRQGGVIPKYTGHIPGIQFSFGESYGPLSDRLLRKHHGNMAYLKRKS